MNGFNVGGITEYITADGTSRAEKTSLGGITWAKTPVNTYRETTVRWGMQVERAFFFWPCTDGILSTVAKIFKYVMTMKTKHPSVTPQLNARSPTSTK